VREQIASALDVVVHLERTREGGRRVAAVGEVVRAAGGVGVRELYGMRGGEVRLLAAPGDGLAERLVFEW
jgi:Flp pilus assembly CpaF family ATPase